MNHILITEKNIKDFSDFLPLDLMPGENRFIIGAYDDDGMVCGVISFSLLEYEYDVDWLYVTDQMRRKKIATGLVNEVFQFIKVTGEIYPINIKFEVSDDDMELLYFFNSIEELDLSYSHERFYVSSSEIAGSEILSNGVMFELETKSFFSLTLTEQKKLLEKTNSSHPFVIEDYDMWHANCLKELCKVYYTNERASGFILFQKRTDSKIECTYIYSQNSMVTKVMITEAAKTVIKLFPKKGVVFDTVDEMMEKMCRKIFPATTTKHIYVAEW